MDNVDEKMDAITGGKPTRAERQRQEIIEQRRKLKAAEQEEHSLAHDVITILNGFNKRLIIIIIVLIVALIGSNMAWLYVFQSYDYTSTTVESTQDGEGVNMVGGGNVTYGAESEDTSGVENKEIGK